MSPSSLLRAATKALAATRARRLRAAATVAALGLALAVSAAPWTFSATAVLQELSRQMLATGGLYSAARGSAALALWPRPHIVVAGVAFADPDGALLIEAERLDGRLALAPLLLGRLEIEEIALERPRVLLDLDNTPLRAAGAAARAAAAPAGSAQARQADAARLGVVVMQNGAARIRRAGEETRIEAIEARLDWPRVGAPAALTASFAWRGERPRALLWVARPGALLRGEETPAAFGLLADSLRLSLEGVAGTGGEAHFSGQLSLASPSLPQALGQFRLSAPLPGPFENIAFTALTRLAPRQARFEAAQFEIDGNRFAGALSLREEQGRPLVEARLTSPHLSLQPMLEDTPQIAEPDGQWSRAPLALPDLAGADVDLRLYAEHARLARFSLDRADVALSLRAGRLELALLSAQAYGGRATARATFAAAQEKLSLRARAQAESLDAGALLGDALGMQNVFGRLDARFSVDAVGDSLAALMRDLDGRAAFALRDGGFGGVDLERALRRLDRTPLASALDIRSGRTPIAYAGAALRILDGVAEVEEGQARGPGFSLTFSGAARLFERALSLKAQARAADSAGRGKGPRLDFEVSGGLEELSLVPDAEALIKRSGAAAPLLSRKEMREEERLAPR